MNKRALRFSVVDGSGKRAATWKLWAETSKVGEEVYLVCRSLGGSLKTSFHSTGNWHTAYSPSTYQSLLESDERHPTRFIETWARPKPSAPGITLAFRIVTPSGSISIQAEAGAKKGIVEIPSASPGKAIEIAIVFTASGLATQGWPGIRAMNTSLVGSVSLLTGETIWAVYRTIDMPDLSHFTRGGVGRYFKGRTNKDLDSGALRALAFSAEADGSRVVFDCAVERRDQSNG